MSEEAPVEGYMDAFRSALARNEVMRIDLPGGGHIHVDRQQPFLCVYRYPADRRDAGTDRLLAGGASYMLMSESMQRSAAANQLLAELAAQLVGMFGAAIVLEIWAAADKSVTVAAPAVGPRIRIVSSALSSPMQTLETLERAILTTDWPGGKPELEIEYVEHIGPRGMPPLFEIDALRESKITLLGLELSPQYRDPASGLVYPEVLRNMQADLWHVLRQAFFTFSHTQAVYRPAHYHELGPRAMTSVVAAADRALALVSDSFDLLLHVTPVNTEAAWDEFHAGGYRRAPKFHYRPLHVNPSELKRVLYETPIDDIEDPALHHLFAMKRDELDRQITMLGDRESPRFALESLQVFGRANADLRQMAIDLLERPSDAEERTVETLDAQEFAAAARQELVFYGEQDNSFVPAVVVSDTVPGIMVSKGKLLIGRHATIDAKRVDATLHHEVGTHMLTYYNGLTQPFQQLHAGLAEYEELQEGLAVFAEYLVGGLGARRLRVLAARVVATESVAEGADFGETFRMLTNDYGFGPRGAYSITMRVHRAGGYVKDVIYLRGLSRLLEHLAKGGDHAELLVGKVSFSQMEVIRELRWRRLIEAPRLRPRYLDQPVCQERLERARQGLNVVDMLSA